MLRERRFGARRSRSSEGPEVLLIGTLATSHVSTTPRVD